MKIAVAGQSRVRELTAVFGQVGVVMKTVRT